LSNIHFKFETEIRPRALYDSIYIQKSFDTIGQKIKITTNRGMSQKIVIGKKRKELKEEKVHYSSKKKLLTLTPSEKKKETRTNKRDK
jgi:hypothetical protein